MRWCTTLPWVLTVAFLGCGERETSTPAASATAAVSASAAPSASASASAAPSASASAAPSAELKDWGCGRKEQKLCPMQEWMKKNVSAAVSAADAQALAKALDVIAAHPIDGYDEWTKIAEEGAAAARNGDIKAAKKSCKGCHKLYQKPFKRDRRDMVWPASP